jgi:hypothetical protein
MFSKLIESPKWVIQALFGKEILADLSLEADMSQ